jgi:dolichol kinase
MTPRGNEAFQSQTTQFSPVSSATYSTPAGKSPASYGSVSFFPGVLPIRLHLRSDLHLMRKAWHVSMGCLIAFLYMSGVRAPTAVTILGSLLGFAIVMETLRLKMPVLNEKIMRVWGPFMRTSEVNRVSGMPFYISAAMIAIAIFPKPVAILSILYLACGDPIASVFGILYGHKSIRLASGKSLIGTAAGVVTCAVVTFLFTKTMPFSGAALFVLPLVGGLAGGLAELLPVDIDDNFTIPVVSGFVMWLTFILLGL